MSNHPNRPIPDSYWVELGRLLAGEYPGAFNELAARQKVQAFLQAGVTFFLDLTEAGELKPYTPFLQQETTHRRMPIKDRHTPTPAEMVAILDTIDAALKANHTVYVHCWGGIGRTGTVVGCYLVRHGMSGQQALAEIAHWRSDTPDGWMASPETTAQRQMVLTWLE